jgi:hypothetical protein
MTAEIGTTAPARAQRFTSAGQISGLLHGVGYRRDVRQPPHAERMVGRPPVVAQPGTNRGSVGSILG